MTKETQEVCCCAQSGCWLHSSLTVINIRAFTKKHRKSTIRLCVLRNAVQSCTIIIIMLKVMLVWTTVIEVSLTTRCDPTYTAVTVGDRMFPVTGSCLWNSLPPDVTSAPTLTVFFGIASKLTSFPDHFLPNCFRFLVLYTVYIQWFSSAVFRPL